MRALKRELFVRCSRTGAESSGFFSVPCPVCGETNKAIALSGDPVGIRLPNLSPTRMEIERAADQLGPRRHARWLACGEHDKKLLPDVSDADLRWCPRCFALFQGDRLRNEPTAARRRTARLT